MNGPDRYRTLRGSTPERAGDAFPGSVEGIDPVTGLPVLIYDFDGEPLAYPGELQCDNIPRILWSGSNGSRGRIVCALSPGWVRLGEDAGPLTLARLLAVSAALRAAAAAGVAHGDLAPQRLLLSGDRLQVEGYGVPWRPRPGPFRAPEVDDAGTLAGDVWSLAKVAGHLGLEAGDETVSAVLEQCTADDPGDRPSAEELFLALESLLGAQAAGKASAEGTREAGKAPTEGGQAAGKMKAAARREADGLRNELRNEATEKEGDSAPTAALPEETEHRSHGERVAPVAGAVESPGGGDPGSERSAAVPLTVDRSDDGSGDESEGSGDGAEAAFGEVPVRSYPLPEAPGERRRRLTLLGALMAAVVILALLALYGPRGSAPPAAPLEDIVYVVQVEVLPGDLPPVTIHLISSPQGSSLTRSDTIGTAPRHLALDRPGTWAFQGSLQGRRSEVVEIEVPEERTVTLVMPQ